MADNFNLRSFLSENKLTKNAQLLNEVSFNGKPVNVGSIEIDGIDMEDYPDFVDAYIVAAEYEDGTPLTDGELEQFQEENYDLIGELIHDNQLYLEEKKEEGEMDEYGLEHDPDQIGDQDKDGDIDVADATIKEALRESRLTAKERRLVEMVQDALGYTNNDEDQEFNPGHDIEQAQHDIERTYSEGEESIEEVKPLPKYNSIEELMKEIEHGTNEAAHKYKMDEMKRVYEALEAKVGSLEEGEHAEHIDQKAVKQMRKDIAALRKAEEKLRKEFDKKFSGKEKKETPAKEKATEALQEGFDLRKFLAENKLTVGSRMLNEKLSYDDFEQMIKPFLDLAKSKGWVWNSSGNSWYDMSSPAIALFHKDVVPTTKDGEYKGQPTELGTNPVAGRSMNVRGPLETKSADVIMSPDYNIEQAYFSAKDKTILDSIKGAMANNTDVIQDIKQTSSEFTSGGDFEPQNYYVMLLRKKGA